MLGFLLFVLTVAGAPHYPVLFIIIAFTWIKRRQLVIKGLKENSKVVKCLLAFIVLITFNALLHGYLRIPNMYLMPFCFMCALGLEKKDAIVFIYLIALECMFGAAEYVSGVNTFLPGIELEDFSSDDLMYFKRVFGFSNNSSSFSEKILFSIFLVHIFKDSFSNNRKIVLIFLFIVGLYTSFNRTVIIAVLLFLLILFYNTIRKELKSNKLLALFTLAFVTIITVLLFSKYGGGILSQFTRGGEEIDLEAGLTGRTFIWPAFVLFISEHFLFGNGSIHYMIPYKDGLLAHAHNSFLQLYADHGFLIASLYLFTILSKVNRQNLIYCVPILFMCLFQYCAFWGFSIPDVFLFAFLCNKRFS